MKASTTQSLRQLFADTEKLVAEIEHAEVGLRVLRGRLRQRLWFLSTISLDTLSATNRTRMKRLMDGTAKAKAVIEGVIKRQQGRFTAASIVAEVRRSNPAVARRMAPTSVCNTLTQLTQLGVLKRFSTKGKDYNYALKS